MLGHTVLEGWNSSRKFGSRSHEDFSTVDPVLGRGASSAHNRDRSLFRARSSDTGHLCAKATTGGRIHHDAAPRIRICQRYCHEGLPRERFGLGDCWFGVAAVRAGHIKATKPGSTYLGNRVNRPHPVDTFPWGTCCIGSTNLVAAPDMTSASHFSQVARSAVFVMLAIISAGVLAAVTSLVRRERPILLPMVGLVVNTVLVGLFWYLRFYALGFDQDLWAPR